MITFAQLSETGEREINEDCVGFVNIGPEIKLFVLADGLGGHGRGEDASALITKTSKELFRKYYQDKHCLHYCFEGSQEELMRVQKEEHAEADLKSTLVLLSVFHDKVQWGHVGDSRLYYFEHNKIIQRTFDHSIPQMLVDAGEIKEKEIRHHPDRNRLLRVMGMEWNGPKYQLSDVLFLSKNERKLSFLLCSDGFWENITEKQMETCLKKSCDEREWLQRMEEIVIANGRGTNMDNYSAIAIWIRNEKEKQK